MTVRTHWKRPSTNPPGRVYFVIVPAGQPVPTYEDAVAAGIGHFADDPDVPVIWDRLPAGAYCTIIGLREPTSAPAESLKVLLRRQPTHPISIKRRLK